MDEIKVEMKQNGLTMEIDRENFAMMLKTWRLRNGLTQKQAGDRFGCSRYTIIRAENAKAVTWEMAYRLFTALAKALQEEKA